MQYSTNPSKVFATDREGVMETSENGKITPERAIEILKRDGLEVTFEQAKLILEFLHQMADIVVAQYLERQN